MEFILALERRTVDWSRAIALIGLAGLLVAAGATLLDVLLRSLANQPIKGLHDINELAMPIVLAACFPVVAAQRQNIRIRFVGRAVGKRAACWLDAFGSACLFAFVVIAVWQLGVYTHEIAESDRTTWLLLIPVTPCWVAATTIFALAVPTQAVILLGDLARAAAGATPAEDDGPEPQPEAPTQEPGL